MKCLYKIEKSLNIKFDKELREFLNPEKVYYKSDNYYVNEGDKVFKDTQVTSYLSSSVSGVAKMEDDCLVIENDYTESYGTSKRLKKKEIEKYDFVKILSDDFIKELSHKTLIINCVDDIPSTYNRKYYLDNNMDLILEMVDLINKCFNNDKVMIIIDSSENDLVLKYTSVSGPFPFIEYKYIKNEYPLYFKDILCDRVGKKEDEVGLITIFDLIELYYIIKRGIALCDRYISIINGSESFVVNVKIGTKLSDLFSNFEININNRNIVLNNILNGHLIDSDYIIDEDTTAIFVVDNIDESSDCINCGNCIRVCPFGCDPLHGVNLNMCRNCGLCKYFCPSKRNIGGSCYEK